MAKAKKYTLIIENTKKQRVKESWDHIPCISEIAETIDLSKYAMDSPWLTRLALVKEGDANA